MTIDNIIPFQNMVVCVQLNINDDNVEGGVYIANKQHLPIYKILKMSSTIDENDFKVGDCIIVNSTGTKIKTDNELFYIFNLENIVGKTNVEE